MNDRMAEIFNEWARRYAEDPTQFASILNPDGTPAEDYGQQAARYYREIDASMPR